MDPNLTTTPLPKIEITFPINEGSLHDSGINQEYLSFQEQLPQRKAVYLCVFQCGYCAQSRATICTHTCKKHLNTMLGCPHCNHRVCSTDAWVKHIHTHHPGLLMFIEIKLEHVTPAESAEVLEVLATSQGSPDTNVQK